MTKGNGLPCKKCGTIKWYANGDCVECVRERNRRWQQSNPDKVREANRQWPADNREKSRENARRWQAANPEAGRVRARRWQQDHPERVREYGHQWQQDHPESRRASKQNRRARKAQAGGSFTAAEWNTLVAQYDGHCCYPNCYRTDLHADHVVPISRGGTSDISNIQPLCAHHNTSKGTKIADYRHRPGIISWIQKKLFG